MSGKLYMVDDNPDHHFLVYQALKQLDESYCATFFEDGRSLYSHLNTLARQNNKEKLPGLIILDLNMPGMNGMQLLTLIKQPANAACLTDMPIVVMSSDQQEEKITQCYKLGANAYIVKPVGYDNIKSTMRAVCRFWLHSDKI